MMNDLFRGVTSATGWVAEVLSAAVNVQPEDTPLGRSSVLHSEQDEVRIVLPEGTQIVVTVHVEEQRID